jgi:hypothetical protein
MASRRYFWIPWGQAITGLNALQLVAINDFGVLDRRNRHRPDLVREDPSACRR